MSADIDRGDNDRHEPGGLRQRGSPVESRISRIARRAYELYEARRGERGAALEDWLEAEREIDRETERARRHQHE